MVNVSYGYGTSVSVVGKNYLVMHKCCSIFSDAIASSAVLLCVQIVTHTVLEIRSQLIVICHG